MKIPTTILLALCVAFYFDQYAQIYTALILTLVAFYAWFDLAPVRIPEQTRNTARWLLVSLVVMLLVVVPTLLQVQQRLATAPYEHIHDGAIQTEQAIQFLLEGKNPYVENYTQTPMAQWTMYGGLDPRDNIALYYLPYLPLTFIQPIPFYLAMSLWVGFFDLRVYQLVIFVALFFLLFWIAQDWDAKLGLAILVPLNPLFLPFFIEGRNDVIVLFWLVTAIYFWQRRHTSSAMVGLGLACCVKATAWFAIPFFLLAAWQMEKSNVHQFVLRTLAPLILVVVIFTLTFVAWNASAFVAGALWYQSSAYQISGQGVARWLLDTGIVPDQYAQFPFSILQFVVGVPVLLVLWRWQSARPTLQRIMAATAILGFVIGYWGRAFADNHIGFILSLALIALFVAQPKWGAQNEI